MFATGVCVCVVLFVLLCMFINVHKCYLFEFVAVKSQFKSHDFKASQCATCTSVMRKHDLLTS